MSHAGDGFADVPAGDVVGAPAGDPAAAPLGDATGRPAENTSEGGRKRHRRVVALSEVDRRRLAAGELSDPVDALHTGDAGPVRLSSEPQRGEGANDARLLRDVPPHWGPRRRD